jgi:Ca2+-binding EF-hand superfamily protein
MIISAICLADASELWRPFDTNKDNALSKAEFGNYLAEQYVALDEDMDGFWNKREFVRRPEYMKRNDPTRLREKFKRWDKDENGVWSLKEAEMAIDGNFEWLDKDKNKLITIKEMPSDF